MQPINNTWPSGIVSKSINCPPRYLFTVSSMITVTHELFDNAGMAWARVTLIIVIIFWIIFVIFATKKGVVGFLCDS